MLQSTTLDDSTYSDRDPFQPVTASPDPFQPQQQQPPVNAAAAPGFAQPNDTGYGQSQQFQMDPGLSGAISTPQQQMQPPQPPSGPFSWCGACMQAFSIDTYRAYFDIDAEDIAKRMKSAVLDFYKPEHFRNEVVGVARTDSLKGPDLYGPFWITMTLIFFVAVTSNMHAYLHRNDVDEFDYDIKHLLHASSTLCIMAFVVPSVLWITTQCLSMQSLQLVEIVCIYGYSLLPFIPAVFLCVIPLGIFSMLALLGATCMSAGLIVRNIVPALMVSDATNSKAPALSVAILVCHGIFFLIMKFRFYHHKSKH